MNAWAPVLLGLALACAHAEWTDREANAFRWEQPTVPPGDSSEELYQYIIHLQNTYFHQQTSQQRQEIQQALDRLSHRNAAMGMELRTRQLVMETQTGAVDDNTWKEFERLFPDQRAWVPPPPHVTQEDEHTLPSQWDLSALVSVPHHRTEQGWIHEWVNSTEDQRASWTSEDQQRFSISLSRFDARLFSPVDELSDAWGNKLPSHQYEQWLHKITQEDMDHWLIARRPIRDVLAFVRVYREKVAPSPENACHTGIREDYHRSVIYLLKTLFRHPDAAQYRHQLFMQYRTISLQYLSDRLNSWLWSDRQPHRLTAAAVSSWSGVWNTYLTFLTEVGHLRDGYWHAPQIEHGSLSAQEERMLHRHMMHLLMYYHQNPQWRGESMYLFPAEFLQEAEDTYVLNYGTSAERDQLLHDRPRSDEWHEPIFQAFSPQTSSCPQHTDGFPFMIRSVDSVEVKIYKIDAIRYYQRYPDARAILADQVRVEGMTPHDVRLYNYSHIPALQTHYEEFRFPELVEENTAYLVEWWWTADTMVRAVVDPVRVHYVHQIMPYGHSFYAFDEKGKPLPPRQVSLYVGEEEFRADPESGEIIVPFHPSQSMHRRVILATHPRYGQVLTLHHVQEQYELQLAIATDSQEQWLHQDDVLEVMARLSLTMSGVSVPVQLMDHVEVIWEWTSGDEVTDRHVFPLDLSHSGPDPLFPLRVTKPSSFSNSARVSVVGLVQPMNQNHPLTLTSPPVRVELFSSDYSPYAWYASPSSVGWTLRLLGRNGEPITHELASVSIRHSGSLQTASTRLHTDEEGKITIHTDGFPHDIISIDVDGNRVYESSLPENSPVRHLYIPPVDTLNVALPQASMPAWKMSLFKTTHDGRSMITDWFDTDIVTFHEHYVSLDDLRPGTYRLFFSYGPQREEYLIHVLAHAIPWDRFLLTPTGAFENALHKANPMITSLQASQDRLEVEFDHYEEGQLRVHLLANEFTPLWYDWKNFFPSAPASPYTQPYPSWHRMQFQEAVRVDGEVQYIHERRAHAPYPSSIWDLPSLLLNPVNIGEAPSIADNSPPIQMNYGNAARSADAQSGGRGVHFTHGSLPGIVLASAEFLRDKSIMRMDLSPVVNADGGFAIRENITAMATGYKPVLTLLFEYADGTILLRRIALPLDEATTPKRRDLALAIPFEEESRVMEHHVTRHVRVGQRCEDVQWPLPCQSGAQMEAYFSVSDLYHEWHKDQTTGSHTSWMKEMLDWDGHSLEKKQELYSTYASHEVNFFLKHRDPDFFTTYIRPALQDKLYPDLMDLLLLDTPKAQLTPFLDPYPFSQLNTLEKILLLPALPTERANRVLHMMEAELRHAAQQMEIDRGYVDEPMRGTQNILLMDTEALMESGSAMPTGARFASMDFQQVAQKRRDVKQRFYTAPQQPQKVTEQTYYRVEYSIPIVVSPFWLEYARALLLSQEVLLPENVPSIMTMSSAEFLLAAAVIDLPLKVGQQVSHTFVDELRDCENDSPSHLAAIVTCHYEATELIQVAGQSSVAVMQSIHAPGRFAVPPHEPLRTHTVYTLHTHLLNMDTTPRSTPHLFDLIAQIPQGAISLTEAVVPTVRPLTLSPYQKVEQRISFYFPEEGEYTIYPAHVFERDSLKCVGMASARQVSVVSRYAPTIVEEQADWMTVGQHGTNDQIIEFLATRQDDLLTLWATPQEQALLLYRLSRNLSLFQRACETLRSQGLFLPEIWRLSVHHQDVTTFREFLQSLPSLHNVLQSLQDDATRHWRWVSRGVGDGSLYRHVEFEAYVAPRVASPSLHLQPALQEQYDHYLKRLEQLVGAPSSVELLEGCYYLLLQQRVADATALLERIPESDSVYYQYLRMYLRYYDLVATPPSQWHGVIQEMTDVCQSYRSHPMELWRQRFLQIENDLEGLMVAYHQRDGPPEQGQPALSLEWVQNSSTHDALQLKISYEHLPPQEANYFSIAYYRIDREHLYSWQPFQPSSPDQHSLITSPNHVEIVSFPSTHGSIAHTLPSAFQDGDVVVEVRYVGGAEEKQLVQTLTSQSQHMRVQVRAAEGRVNVNRRSGTDDIPWALCYVKVYALLTDGHSIYWKDGYTDLWGDFDYLTTNTSAATLPYLRRLALFVQSPDGHSQVLEVSPPPW